MLLSCVRHSSLSLHGNVLCLSSRGCGLPWLGGSHCLPCASASHFQPVPASTGSPWPSAVTRLSRSGSCEGPETPCWGDGCSWKKVTHGRGGTPWGMAAVSTPHQGGDCPPPQWRDSGCGRTTGLETKMWSGNGKPVRWKEQRARLLVITPPWLPALSVASTGRWDGLTITSHWPRQSWD